MPPPRYIRPVAHSLVEEANDDEDDMNTGDGAEQGTSHSLLNEVNLNRE